MGPVRRREMADMRRGMDMAKPADMGGTKTRTADMHAAEMRSAAKMRAAAAEMSAPAATAAARRRQSAAGGCAQHETDGAGAYRNLPRGNVTHRIDPSLVRHLSQKRQNRRCLDAKKNARFV